MNTTPCPQPPGEPFDGKPRVIVLKEDLEMLEKGLADANSKWKEYCGEYDLMLARWKDEKAEIAKRCGFPWDINGVGLEPWVSADKLMAQSLAKDELIEKLVARLEEQKPLEQCPFCHAGGEPCSECLFLCRLERRNRQLLQLAREQGYPKQKPEGNQASGL